MAITLKDFIPLFGGPESYVEARAPMMTPNRMRYLLRHYRETFVDAGLMIQLGNALYVVPALLDEELLRIAREQARACAGLS